MQWNNEKPDIQEAKLDYSNPFTQHLKMALLCNEHGGNKIWDMVTQNYYTMSTATPTWGSEGLEFLSTTYMPYIITKPLNEIMTDGFSATMLFGYKRTSSPGYHYFFTVGSTYTIFSMLWQNTDDAGHTFIDGVEPTFFCDYFLRKRILGITFNSHKSTGCIQHVYGDGVYMASGSADRPIPTTSTELFYLGGRADNFSRHIGGFLDFFYWWNVPFTHRDVGQISQNPFQIILQDKEYNFIPSEAIISDNISMLIYNYIQQGII